MNLSYTLSHTIKTAEIKRTDRQTELNVQIVAQFTLLKDRSDNEQRAVKTACNAR